MMTGELHDWNIGERPFCWDKMIEYIKSFYEEDIGDPKKIVIIGADLTKDVMFGNLNNMQTIWITQFAG